VTLMWRRTGRTEHDPRRRRDLGRSDPGTTVAPASSSRVHRRPPARSSGARTELGWEFVQIYGLTETTPVLTMNRTRAEWDDLSPAERAVRLNRAGAPVVGCTMAVSESGEVARPRQHGHGRVLGPTRRHGRRDQERLLPHRRWWPDRRVQLRHESPTARKTSSSPGGENVSSIEVEDAIFQHPEVTEVAVIGIPTRSGASSSPALVVTSPGSRSPRPTSSPGPSRSSPATSVRRRSEFRTELARTATGKLQKFKLREPFWQGHDRQVN